MKIISTTNRIFDKEILGQVNFCGSISHRDSRFENSYSNLNPVKSWRIFPIEECILFDTFECNFEKFKIFNISNTEFWYSFEIIIIKKFVKCINNDSFQLFDIFKKIDQIRLVLYLDAVCCPLDKIKAAGEQWTVSHGPWRFIVPLRCRSCSLIGNHHWWSCQHYPESWLRVDWVQTVLNFKWKYRNLQ